MKRNHYAYRDNLLFQAGARILLILIGIIQAVGTIFVGISVVVLKPVAILMIAAAGLLLLIAQFPWKDALPVFLISTILFWIPEMGALVLVGLTAVQGKLAAEL